MTVTAKCNNCSDEHPLGDRSYDGELTTTCPSCGAPCYQTSATETVTKSERERIVDAVSDIDGVGEQTVQSICAAFDLYASLSTADIDELTDVDYVGEQTAQQIVAQT